MTIESETLLLLRSSTLADTEPDLGARLMRGFLEQLADSHRLPGKIIFMGSGIFLSTEGSPVLDVLRRLAEAGCDLASCATCLDYYGRRHQLRVGREGNMKETVRAMTAATKVLSP